MGSCQYCNTPAGLFRKKHSECEAAHIAAKKRIVAATVECIHSTSSYATFMSRIDMISQDGFINDITRRDMIIAGWEQVVDSYLEDGLLDQQEEESLAAFMESSGFSQEMLDANGAWTRMIQASLLRELTESDDIPKKIRIEGTVPFNLQKNEELVWLFNDVKYLEERTQRSYVGGSQGVSIRIAKGVYYRTSAFKGNPVDTKVTVPIDVGFLGVTQKHIYFAGPSKAFRVNYNKIVAFNPFSDGIGIVRDVSNAKLQLFITGDGWFTYNLVMNLMQRAK
jgi:hypothetical protein